MSNYLNLRDDMTLGIKVMQKPSQYVWKNNPLSESSVIASNESGYITEDNKPLHQIKKEKPYEYSYQGCCNVTLPVSEQYKSLKEVIFSP